MKRFEIKVTSSLDQLTIGDSSGPLTSVTTEIVAKDHAELVEKVDTFLGNIAPFHSLPTGCSVEEAQEIVTRRNDSIVHLRGFSTKSNDMWTAKRVIEKFNHWEIDLVFMVEF